MIDCFSIPTIEARKELKGKKYLLSFLKSTQHDSKDVTDDGHNTETQSSKIKEDGLYSNYLLQTNKRAHCIFE